MNILQRLRNKNAVSFMLGGGWGRPENLDKLRDPFQLS